MSIYKQPVDMNGKRIKPGQRVRVGTRKGKVEELHEPHLFPQIKFDGQCHPEVWEPKQVTVLN